jgi:hypothetical protein
MKTISGAKFETLCISVIYFVSIIYSALLSVSHLVPYDITVMSRNGYGLIKGTVTIIIEGLRKSQETLVRTADIWAEVLNTDLPNKL